MKKITILSLLLTVSFAMNAQTFNFNTDGDQEGWIGKNATLSVAAGIMSLTPDNHKNPNIQLNNGIDADANGYIHLGVKNHSNIANEIRFLIKNSAGNGDSFVNAAMNQSDSDFQVYSLELSGADGWSGIVDAITIRFTERNTKLNGVADMIDLDYIIFDSNPTMNVKSLEKFNFSFYPNPVQNEVNLFATQPIEQITVYSLLGQEVLNLKFDNQSKPIINMSSLSAGIYNMKVKIAGTLGIVKLIKK